MLSIGLIGFYMTRFKPVINFKVTDLEYGSKVNLIDIIDDSNVEIIDEEINTYHVGSNKMILSYKDKHHKIKKYQYDINIYDDEKPIIIANSQKTITKGTDIDLLKGIICVDNADSNVECSVEGTYDINTIGTYNLTYIAVDSSNNKTTKNLTLSVIEPVTDEKPKEAEEPTYIDFSDIVTKYKDDSHEIGIDISRWQGDIDYSKLDPNIDFVMIRIGYQDGYNGICELDKKYLDNIKGFTDAGIKVGLYFYSYATTRAEALNQADWVIDNIGDYDIELPIVFDWENWSTFNDFNLNLYEFNNIAYSFMEEIKFKGYNTLLYGSKSYLTSMWKPNNYGVWVAQYYDYVTYEGKYQMWQLTENGKVDGIDYTVDIDILYK